MKFLIDGSAATVEKKASQFPHLVGGQFLTPLTRYTNYGGTFAIDNGAFSVFHAKGFQSLIRRNFEHRANCLFVTVPDIVGCARRTLEIWRHRNGIVNGGFPLALVAQNGIEDMDIPWEYMHAVFIGGTDPWKDSRAVMDIVKTAKILGKHVHVGRVNTVKRYRLFAAAGADTCDGSGVARYDHMLEDIAASLQAEPEPLLFDVHGECEQEV